MKVKIIEQPSGLVRFGDQLMEWPEVGGVVDLPALIAEGMIASGTAERVSAPPVEKRPAPTAGVEKRAPQARKK